MIYNIHPLLVHFPIAFLLLYSLIILLPMQKWFSKITWKASERLLLVLGTIGIFLAKASGETAQELTKPKSNLVEMHELFANAVTWFYIILIIIEFLPLIVSFLEKKKITLWSIPTLLKKIHRFINKKIIIKTCALLGLISLFITGLLGGVMVYGATADPLAPFILKLLGL